MTCRMCRSNCDCFDDCTKRYLARRELEDGRCIGMFGHTCNVSGAAGWKILRWLGF